MQIHTITKNRQSGFSLLEILLAVGVLGAIIVGASTITQQWAGGQVTDNAARHMQQIRQAVQEYIMDDFENLPTVGGNPNCTGPCDSVIELINADYLSDDFPARNPIGQEMTIDYRAVGDSIQAFIYPDPTANDPVENIRVMEAVRAGGAGLGHIGEPPPVDEAVGFGQSWQIDPNGDFGIGTPFNTADGSYLTGQVWVSEEEFAGPYLLRNDIGNPDFNTMATDLNMGLNDITNAGNITSETIQVNDQATFDGNLAVNNSTTLSGTTDAGDITANGTLTTGNLNVTGNSDVDVADLVVGNSATVTELNADGAEANQMTVTGLATINNLDVTNNIDATGVTVNNALIAGDVNTNRLNASVIDGGGGGNPIPEIRASDLDVFDLLNVNGTAQITTGEFTDVTIDNYTCNGTC
jgi:type II secretory pathway pseudopilin PulG/cytoskeletal protein CcmA (bactofilin family)